MYVLFPQGSNDSPILPAPELVCSPLKGEAERAIRVIRSQP